VHDLCAAHGETGTAKDVELDRDIGQVLVLHVQSGFDLDKDEAVAPSLEDVDRNEDVLLEEASLVNGAEPLGECVGRRGNSALEVMVGHIDEDTAGHVLASQLTDPVPTGEECLLTFVAR
jgi:hypothetical protein